MTDRTAAIVDQDRAETVEVLGPTLAILTPPDGPSGSPCVLRGSIPAGGVVPLHTHADPETFLVESGGFEGTGRPGEGAAAGCGCAPATCSMCPATRRTRSGTPVPSRR